MERETHERTKASAYRPSTAIKAVSRVTSLSVVGLPAWTRWRSDAAVPVVLAIAVVHTEFLLFDMQVYRTCVVPLSNVRSRGVGTVAQLP